MGEPRSRGGGGNNFFTPPDEIFQVYPPLTEIQNSTGVWIYLPLREKVLILHPPKWPKKPICPPFTDKNLIYPPQKFPKISTPPCIPLLIFWGKIPPGKIFKFLPPPELTNLPMYDCSCLKLQHLQQKNPCNWTFNLIQNEFFVIFKPYYFVANILTFWQISLTSQKLS